MIIMLIIMVAAILFDIKLSFKLRLGDNKPCPLLSRSILISVLRRGIQTTLGYYGFAVKRIMSCS